MLEFKNIKEDVRPQLRQYYAHALSIQKHPVWSIVMFTDDVPWQLDGPLKIPVAYSYEGGFTKLTVDVIKLRTLRAETLIKQRHLLGKLLALKADTSNLHRDALVLEIYQARHAIKAGLPDNIDTLIDQFIRAYGQLSKKRVQKIQQEAKTIVIAPTITEHYQEMFKLEGQIETLTKLFEEGVFSQD